ncbi:MAG: tRNA lysidine(34) synthetase TilS [Parachlamydiaceae bacterium]|nr:tRNA lysidine(34) synthetase TilS [Parachlamydiaceae bacterium]
MKSTVYQFLKERCDMAKPLLIGLSGGPDSLALLYTLMEIKDLLPIKLGIAHVDHSWRECSAEEATKLELLAHKLSLPFHLKVLNPKILTGNLEEACRLERLAFFRELSTENGYQAVLLGHHADDQTETVLKKIFEGSELPFLQGMHQETYINGVKIWRPLLNLRKFEMVRYLQNRSLIPFEDKTNEDPQFLRARFRKTILPLLSNHFGKEIFNCLNRIGRDSAELTLYLDEQIKTYIDHIVFSPFGISIDLSQKRPTSAFEFRHLLRRFCDIKNISFSRALLDKLVELLESGVANKEIRTKDTSMQIDRHRLFLIHNSIPVMEKELEIVPGIFIYGGWTLEIRAVTYSKELPTTDWTSAWKGEVQVVLPEGKYRLLPPKANYLYKGSGELGKWWNNAKVPAFLRNFLPVVSNGTDIVHEFLTGRRKDFIQPGTKAISISFHYK